MKLADIKLGQDYYLLAPNARFTSYGSYGKVISLEPFSRNDLYFSRPRAEYVTYDGVDYKIPISHGRRREGQRGATQLAVLRLNFVGDIVRGYNGPIVEVVPVSHFRMTRDERWIEEEKEAERAELLAEQKAEQESLLKAAQELLESRFETARQKLPEHLRGEVSLTGTSVNMSLDTFETFARRME